MTSEEPGIAAPVPRDSATVILLRDRPHHGIEAFMVRRHKKSAFMGDAYVFPGGTMDAEDDSAELHGRARGHDDASAALALSESEPVRALSLFCAAIRETFEEAGVLLADVLNGADLGPARERLVRGASFVEILSDLDAYLRLDWLVPHSRWITPVVEPRRYDARFFLALLPLGQAAAHDRVETTAGAWLAPEEALDRERKGEMKLPPPTLRTLEDLLRFGTAAEAVASAAREPPPRIEPLLVQSGESFVLCLPGDPEHPVRDPALPGPTRLVLQDGRWWSRHAPDVPKL